MRIHYPSFMAQVVVVGGCCSPAGFVGMFLLYPRTVVVDGGDLQYLRTKNRDL